MAAMDSRISARFALIACSLLLVGLCPIRVFAQDSCTIPAVTNQDDAVPALDQLRLHQCLGGSACTTSECKWVADLLSKGPGKDANEAGEKVLALLGKLSQSISTLDSKALGVPQLKAMSGRWKLPSLSATPETVPTVILESNTREWQGKNLLLFLHTPYELDLGAQLCASALTAKDCQADLESAVQVYTLSDLVHATLGTVTQDKIAGVGKMLKIYDARWTAFHTKSLAVLPWELVANNLFYKSAADGFSGPPNYQWIVLHPSAAVVYDTRQSDKLQGAVLLDVIGRYQWKWGGANEAEITRPWGAALAMSWHGNAPGYGVSVHMPRNWSVALTRSSGNKWQVIASVEFAQYITDKQKNVEDIRKKLEDIRLH
jgi:hypothetical protein